MPNQLLVATFLLIALASCGSDPGESAGSGPDGDALPGQQADVPEGGSRDALVISPRTYTGGTVRAKVTGFFEVDGSQDLNKPASLTDEDQTWLQYGVSGGPGLDVLFTNSTAMAEHGVTIGLGPNSVTTVSTSGECRTKVEVSPAGVSGHYSCTGSTGYNNKTGEMGKVDIEVDFEAGS